MKILKIKKILDCRSKQYEIALMHPNLTKGFLMVPRTQSVLMV